MTTDRFIDTMRKHLPTGAIVEIEPTTSGIYGRVICRGGYTYEFSGCRHDGADGAERIGRSVFAMYQRDYGRSR